MSPETLRWLLVGHIFGFLMWVGTLFGMFHILTAHAKAGKEASAFAELEKSSGIAMDVGATLAIVFGVLMLVLPEHGLLIFKAGGFFHIKLTLVVGLIGAHVYMRRKIRQFRNGDISPPPSWLFPLMSLTVLAIVIAIIIRPFAKSFAG